MNRRMAKKRNESLATYIYRVLQQNGKMGISMAAMSVVNDIVQNAFRTLMKDAQELCSLRKKKTLTKNDLRSSVLLNFPVELGKDCIEFGETSCQLYETAHTEKGEQKTRSEVSGLIFPVGKFHRFMRAFLAGDGGKSGGCGNRKDGPSRIQSSSSVFMAAVLQLLTSKLFILTSEQAKEVNRDRVRPRQITLAVRQDDEFSIYLSSDVVIRNGGVVPFIHSLLLPHKK